ncbi:MAG: hypothetical protein LBP26_02105 [Clostridiales bacterium]|jgi:hypothetical protein|nr:hypothetical protein [Clostridiales bacterium]
MRIFFIIAYACGVLMSCCCPILCTAAFCRNGIEKKLPETDRTVTKPGFSFKSAGVLYLIFSVTVFIAAQLLGNKIFPSPSFTVLDLPLFILSFVYGISFAAVDRFKPLITSKKVFLILTALCLFAATGAVFTFLTNGVF